MEKDNCKKDCKTVENQKSHFHQIQNITESVLYLSCDDGLVPFASPKVPPCLLNLPKQSSRFSSCLIAC